MCSNVTRSRRDGFTLVELMVVVVIIGVLASLVTVSVRGHIITAKQNAAKAEISSIKGALETFNLTYDRYPTSEEGLAVMAKPSDKFPEKLLEGEPIDPWGRPYIYILPGTDGPYEIVSYGADGKEGGTGADKDIRSSQLKEK